MALSPLARTLILAALLLPAVGCRSAPELQPTPIAELRFASDYIQALRDSGAAAVLPRTHPRTRALRGVETNLTVLHDALQASQATLTLARWTIRQVTDQTRKTEVMYASQTPGAPSEVGVWIESYEGHLVVETFFVGRPVPNAPPR